MRPRTEELLYLLMWAGGTLARPSHRNLQLSFVEWTRINGLERRLYDLRRQNLLEKPPASARSLERVQRLTTKALLQLQPVNPPAQWHRAWDGRWRILLFDLPANKSALRYRLWRFLRNNRFGYLQNSVWVTPDSSDVFKKMRGDAVDVSTLTLLEARPCGGESDQDIVNESWDFAAINRRYSRYLALLDTLPGPDVGIEVWRPWILREKKSWSQLMRTDPFLPAPLLPEGYLGRKAWERRQGLLDRPDGC